jgi:hypothetical protein
MCCLFRAGTRVPKTFCYILLSGRLLCIDKALAGGVEALTDEKRCSSLSRLFTCLRSGIPVEGFRILEPLQDQVAPRVY